jgi:DNA-binding response OmpR family regulator
MRRRAPSWAFHRARVCSAAVSDRGLILLVEDDREIASALALELEHERYRVMVESDGLRGLAAADAHDPDLLILDVMLPAMSGIEVCRRLRSRSPVPIVMLTARSSVRDRVDGLDAGADDYLAKPFSFEELLARVRACMRRNRRSLLGPRLGLADLRLDCDHHRVERAGHVIDLTRREFDLLELLLRHPGQVLSRETIFEEVWGYDFLGDSNVIDVYIGHLRRKIDMGFEPKLLHTVRGVGYTLRKPR